MEVEQEKKNEERERERVEINDGRLEWNNENHRLAYQTTKHIHEATLFGNQTEANQNYRFSIHVTVRVHVYRIHTIAKYNLVHFVFYFRFEAFYIFQEQ